MEEDYRLGKQGKASAQPLDTYAKVWYGLIIGTFFAVIATLGLIRVFTPTPTVSAIENRTLKAMPAFSLQALFKGRFTRELDDFYADTFIFRDQFIAASDTVDLFYTIPLSGVDTVLEADVNAEQMNGPGDAQGDEETGEEASAGEETVSPEASGDSNAAAPEETVETDLSASPEPAGTATPEPTEAVIDEPEDMQKKGSYLLTDSYILRSLEADPKVNKKWADALGRLQNALPGNRVIAIVPPSGYAFYAPTKYYKPELDQKLTIQALYGMLDSRIIAIDTYPFLQQHTQEYIYFRTDHHWTARGAYWAYAAFADKLGLTPVPLESMTSGKVNERFLGSYYNQFKNNAKARIIKKNPDTVEYFNVPVESAAMAYDSAGMKGGKKVPVIMLDKIPNNVNYYRTFLGGDYPCMRIQTGMKNGRSILFVKDSYANAFIPFMMPHYETIYVVDYRDHNAGGKSKFKITDFVKKNAVDDVVVFSCYDFVNASTFVNWFIKSCP